MLELISVYKWIIEKSSLSLICLCSCTEWDIRLLFVNFHFQACLTLWLPESSFTNNFVLQSLEFPFLKLYCSLSYWNIFSHPADSYGKELSTPVFRGSLSELFPHYTPHSNLWTTFSIQKTAVEQNKRKKYFPAISTISCFPFSSFANAQALNLSSRMLSKAQPILHNHYYIRTVLPKTHWPWIKESICSSGLNLGSSVLCEFGGFLTDISLLS